MAVFTESTCIELLHESLQIFMNLELSSIDVQRICEECKKYNLSISESYLLEASGSKPSDLKKDRNKRCRRQIK